MGLIPPLLYNCMVYSLDRCDLRTFTFELLSGLDSYHEHLLFVPFASVFCLFGPLCLHHCRMAHCTHDLCNWLMSCTLAPTCRFCKLLCDHLFISGMKSQCLRLSTCMDFHLSCLIVHYLDSLLSLHLIA